MKYLTWTTPGVTAVQVRVLSPNGPAMTGFEPASASAITGDWVTNGMLFYLQDASTGDSAGPGNTLATLAISGMAR